MVSPPETLQAATTVLSLSVPSYDMGAGYEYENVENYG
jgi:hypothetical protein